MGWKAGVMVSNQLGTEKQGWMIDEGVTGANNNGMGTEIGDDNGGQWGTGTGDGEQ